MGEGAGGGGQDKHPFGPPPLHPLPPKGGEIFLDYVFSIMDSLVSTVQALRVDPESSGIRKSRRRKRFEKEEGADEQRKD